MNDKSKPASLTRREFLVNTTCAGTGLLIADTGKPAMVWAATVQPALEPYLTGLRMAATPAVAYRAYRSKAVANPVVKTWVQIDLGKSVAIDAIRLYPASERMYPGRDQYYAGEGFPLRFVIEASNDKEFSSSTTIADFRDADFPDPEDNITEHSRMGTHGRYVRLTATRLRPVKAMPASDVPTGKEPQDSPEYTLTIAKLAVLSNGADLAVGCNVRADAALGNQELAMQLTRAYREDGETIYRDNPHTVTDPSTWTPPKRKVLVPRSGITLHGGVFHMAMENNIQYLLESYSTDDLLRQFYERTGKVKDFKPIGSQKFWEEDLAGSNAGRFLMGAGNTLRWMHNPELQRRLDAVVDGIAECREPNGYIMAYPQDTIFYSERAAYTRAWLTHGLLEAAYSGNKKALPMLRGYYDWFNSQSFLPEMLRRAIQGGQGMVANTRVAMSPVGVPKDAQVIQQYYQEDGWLKGLAMREKEQVWQYPYDRPHCYLLTDLEAYLDMYLVTGHQHYFDAVQGAAELYRAHWQQAGGSISIIEFETNPPDSNSLTQKLGELCGSSFWAFLNQRFHELNPENECFVAEIEKSIYNVGIANQQGVYGIRYHTILEGKKEQGTRENTCCEGQGTRLIGSIPEHIYSIAPDGLYLNLFAPSTMSWKQDDVELALHMETEFPHQSQVKLTMSASRPKAMKLRVRVPSWALSEVQITVNGHEGPKGVPGSYVLLDRIWSQGDTVTFNLSAGFVLTEYTGSDQIPGHKRYALEYGPILYAAVGPKDAQLRLGNAEHPNELSKQLIPKPNSPMQFTVAENPGITYMPYWQVQDEEFTCFPVISV